MARKPTPRQILETLWGSSLSGLALVSTSGELIGVNKSICDMLEYTESEMKELTFADITHEDDLKVDLHLARRVAEKEIKAYDMRKRYITKTGRTIWMILRVSALKNDEGHFLCFLSQVSPINSANKNPTSKGGFWNWCKNNWGILITAFSAIAFLVSELIKALVSQ